MAVLAVIGGIDSRLRLGGQVAHEEFGEGTVTRITPKGRITVQFSDTRASRVCPLSQLKPVGTAGLAVLRGSEPARALVSGLRPASHGSSPGVALRGAASSSPSQPRGCGEGSSPRLLPAGVGTGCAAARHLCVGRGQGGVRTVTAVWEHP